MGNKVITSVCMRDESLDIQDFSNADFDFISVAVRSGSACTTPSSRAFVPATTKMVAVVPVDLGPGHSSSYFGKVSMKPTASPQQTSIAAISPIPTPATSDDDEPEYLSFNDCLNMLTWDPENLAPTHTKTTMMPLSTSRPQASPEPAQALKQKTPFGWLSRAISSYKTFAALKKQAKDLKTKQTKQPTQQQQHDNEDKQQKKKKMIKTQASSIKTQASTITINQEQEQSVVQPAKELKHNKYDGVSDCEELISDTESESSAAEFLFCDEDTSSSSSSSSTMFTMAYSFLRKESSSNSIGSCETFEANAAGDDDQVSIAYFSANASSVKMRDYLCKCGSCPVHSEIEREVATSTCWMNERERQSICRILQAYSTYNEAAGFSKFSKRMLSYAEECLLVFHGDENAAFNAFVLLGRENWE